MILQLNHLQAKAAAATQEVVEAVYGLLSDGNIEPNEFSRLRIQLDWLQYKKNFREVVLITQGQQAAENPGPIAHVQVDTRQVVPGCLKPEMLRAMLRAKMPRAKMPRSKEDAGDCDNDRLPLEDFQPFRSSIAWDFNRLYWHRLKDWEMAIGKSYERSLPGGQSDANHPEAIADAVGDFWTLLRDLEAKQRLPQEIFILEIGVGTGKRYGF